MAVNQISNKNCTFSGPWTAIARSVSTLWYNFFWQKWAWEQTLNDNKERVALLPELALKKYKISHTITKAAFISMSYESLKEI